jgi:hypothetical protein
MQMKQPFSFEEFSQQELELYRLIARKGNTSWPVYSGDVAAALQIRHRVLKDLIEANYSQLRVTAGAHVHRVHHKRKGMVRAMNGYLLSLHSVLQVLYNAGCIQPDVIPELCQPEFLHTCLCSERFVDCLN